MRSAYNTTTLDGFPSALAATGSFIVFAYWVNSLRRTATTQPSNKVRMNRGGGIAPNQEMMNDEERYSKKAAPLGAMEN